MTVPIYDRFISIVRQEHWLMDALQAVRKLDLSDWYIAAGAIRNTVWNRLHNYEGRSNQHDVDVAYFDPLHLEEATDKEYERVLATSCPSLRWEVVNQARAHSFGQRPKVFSAYESIAYWSETPTCVGIRLEKDDSLSICAPYGLDDLMGLVVRPIPLPLQDLTLYRRRIEQKHWERTWPQLQIVRV